MKYIITESQVERLWIKRRMPEIINAIRDSSVYQRPCGYSSVYDYMGRLKRYFFSSLPHEWWLNMQWDYEFVWMLIMELHGKEIKDNYLNRC